MRVLITGSSGFLGRHFAAALSEHDLTCLDTDVEVDAMRFFANQTLAIARSEDAERFDLVLHCAAMVNGRRGIDGSPAKLHAYNTMLDATMFNWALEARPGRVVYFSSAAAYPAINQVGPKPLICRERDIYEPEPLRPETSYGMSKLHGEQVAYDVRRAGVPVTVVRPFSGYGADQSPDYPFRSFIDRARAKQDPFEIWGDGRQVRDWIHVEDIVEAVLTAAEYGIDGPVNICTGIGTSFTDLAEMVTKAAGYRPALGYREDRPAGVDYRVGDPTKMLEFHTPAVTLEQGIEQALSAEG